MNWEQFKAILWLRWRLTRNQFRRGGQVNVALSIFGAVMLAIVAVGLGVGGFALGLFAGAKTPAPVLLLIWDGFIFLFLIFWLAGLMVEIQRSESIDLTKLLHLPVSLPQVFAFNFAASHLTPVILLLMPGMLGFCAGLTLGAGPAMILLVPLVLGFVFMLSAWTYCLRGWLTALMTNKRRRRTIILWLTIGVVLLGQLPNIVLNSPYFRNRTRQLPHQPQTAQTKSSGRGAFALPELLVAAHSVVPPGWIGYAAMDLRQGGVLSAPAFTVAGFLIGVLGLIRAYRMTLSFYRGADNKTRPRPIPQTGVRERGPLLVERRLPWLPDDTAALALATFRGLLRAPELKIAFIMPVVLGVVLSTLWFARLKQPPTGAFTGFAATAAVMLVAFSLAPTMSNTFGLDRSGFRALVLLPTRRHHILLAKNLAFFPFVLLGTLILLTLVKFLLHLQMTILLVGLLQVPTAFMLFSLLGNILSILVPYRLAEGTLRAKKPKAIVVLAAMGMMLLTPIVLLPIAVPQGLQLLFSSQGWLPWLPVNLLAATVILAAVAWLYHCLLPLQGRLLQRREQTILREVTEEVE